MIKPLIKNILKKSGFQLVPAGRNERLSFDGVFSRLANHIHPRTVIDVGAAYGDFSVRLRTFFPNATYVLCEPLSEYLPVLETCRKKYNFLLVQEAIGEKEGTVNFFVHDDFVGSSLKRETEGTHVDGVSRDVPMTTLDRVKERHHLLGPMMLKVDVQGAELDVLRGATEVLPLCDAVILEVSFFQSMIDGLDACDIISFMKGKGFVVYDILSLLYRPYDGALAQADIVFVPEASSLRVFQGYASKEQREKQILNFQRKHKNFLKNLYKIC